MPHRNSEESHEARKALRIVSWNVNGINDKRYYLKDIIEQLDPDILFLSETKRRRAISLFTDIAADRNVYRAVQIRSTYTMRGGLVAIIKMKLKLERAEVLTLNNGNDFVQDIVLTDREKRAYVGWYNSPMMKKDTFGNKLRRILTKYDTQIKVGYLNARHPRWCTDHDRSKRESTILGILTELPTFKLHATPETTFVVLKNKKHRRNAL